MALLAALVLGACGGKSHPDVAPQPKGKLADDAEHVAGRGVFVATSQRCHGPTGAGLTAPRLAGVVTGTYPDLQNETNAVTNGTRSANAGRNARRTTAQENNVPRPDTARHASGPAQCGHSASGNHTYFAQASQYVITNSPRAAPVTPWW